MKPRTVLSGFLALLFSLFQIHAQTPNANQLVILSGLKTGSYFQLAKDIQALNDSMVIVKTSEGSMDNYKKLLNDKNINIAFLQYDVLLMAKLNDFKNRTHTAEKIKILLPLASEDIHLIVRVNSNINTLKDLQGKKVAMGVPGKEGTYVTASYIKTVTALDWKEVHISFDSAFVALLNGQIDAMFFVGYAPVKKLADLVPTFNQVIKLVPIRDERLDRIHVKTVIPAGTYPWLYQDIPTYGVKSVLAVNTDFDSPALVKNYQKLLELIKLNFDYLKETGSPKWKKVDLNYKNLDWEYHPVYHRVF